LWGNDNYLAKAGSAINLNIEPDHSPVVFAPVLDQVFERNKTFTFDLPTNTFVDVDKGDSLRYTASLSNGDNLPDWLLFNPVTGSFIGVPPAYGKTTIRVTATDNSGLSETNEFSLIIQSLEITGTLNNDTLNGSAGNDIISGLDGNDTLAGKRGDDTLFGGEGDDTIYGEDGDDILNGGGGYNYLAGGNGNDTYIFDPGYSNDTISDTVGMNKIVFSAGISSDQISVSNSGDYPDDLILTDKISNRKSS